MNPLRSSVVSFAVVLSVTLAVAPVLAANESITLAQWPSGWSSNSAGADIGVRSCNISLTVCQNYDSVEHYIKGVLDRECWTSYWGESPGYLEGYKAVAVAARNILVNKHQLHSGMSFDIYNDDLEQTDQYGITFASNIEDAVGDQATKRILSYPNDAGWDPGDEPYAYAAHFSSIDPATRIATYNAGDGGTGFGYRPYLRSAFQENDQDVLGGRSGGNPLGVGMSQFGAMHYSGAGWTYQQILEHYYHASPPHVKKLVIKQGTTVVHLKEWEDQFNSPFDPLQGRREKPGAVTLPVDNTQDLAVEVYYSEDVGNETIPVSMLIDGCANAPAPTPGQKRVPLTFRTIEEVGGTKYYNRATGTISKSDISAACLGGGTHQIRLMGRHRYVGGWALDSNPATVSFDGSEGANRYEQGSDLNHQLLVSTTPPKKPTIVEGRAGNGKARFAWVAPTEDIDGHLVADPLQFRLYYSRDPNDANPQFESTTTESWEMPLENEIPLFACVTAIDDLGNESECSDMVAVTPRDARWVHQNGGPNGSYTSISAALFGASPGTTIMVGPGVYEEASLIVGDDSTPDWNPLDVWLVSERGPAETKIITGLIEVGDKCRVIGFTLAQAAEALSIFFDKGVLVANNIFLGNGTAIYSGGSGGEPHTVESVNRIYNNVFAGNVTGIWLYFEYNVTDIQNNLFEGTDQDHVGIATGSCGSTYIRHNNFNGLGSSMSIWNNCALIGSNSTCSPQFEDFNASNLLASDFRLEPGDNCTEDRGAANLQYEGKPWDDCAEFDGNGYQADLGAFGGPFAYIDKNGNAIPDCSEPRGWSSGVSVLKNSTNQPVTLAARSMEAGALTYSVTAPTVHGDLAGVAPNLSYSVTPEFAGADGLSFTVANSVGQSPRAQVNITVKESNTPPTALEQYVTLGTPGSNMITLQGSDADGDPLSFSVVSEPPSGAVVCLHPGECLYIKDESTHGEVQFSYQAHDGIGESEPATVTVLVNSKPTVSFPWMPGWLPPSLYASSTASVAWESTDADGDPLVVALYLDTDRSGFDGTLIAADLPGEGSYDWDVSTLAEGSYFVYAEVRDQWNSHSISSYRTMVVDHTPPVVTINPPADLYGAAQEVWLAINDESKWIGDTLCTTDGTQPTLGSPNCAWPIIVDHSLTLQWLVFDYAGNQSVGSAVYVIDVTPPTVSPSPPGGVYGTEQVVTLVPSETAAIHCTTDGTPPTTASPIYSAPILVDHSLTLRWLARDTVGHESVGSVVYVIDTVSPDVSIVQLANPLKQCLEVTVTGEREAGATVTLTADRPAEIGTVAEPSPATWSCAVRNLGLGQITFTATATDAAHNTASAQMTTVIYNQPPSISSSYPKGSALDLPVDGSAQFWVTASDPDPDDTVLSLTWTLDGQVIGSGSSLDFNPDPQLADGIPKALTLTASDGFLSAARTWQVTVHQVDLIDDDACSYTGSWGVYASASGYLGRAYHRSTGADAGAATCTASLASAGTYKVYARWPAASTHDPDAVYRITLLDGKFDDILVDQTADGGEWNLLGTYAFGTTAVVTLLSTAGDMAVADGIRLVATADPADIVLDDVEGALVGTWNSLSGGFRGTYHTAAGTQGGNTFTWTPGPVAAGTWDLMARWRAITGGADDVKYVLDFDGERTSQVTVDQTVLGGRWNPLGTYSFESTDAPVVRITDNAGGTVVADGVKFVYRDAGSVTIVDNDGDKDLDPNSGDVPDRFAWSGYWTGSSGVAGFVGTGYQRIDPGIGGWAKWLLYIPEAGNYEVFARWTEATDRSSSVRYELRRKGVTGTTAMIVDQKSSGGQWVYLGRFAFEKDDDAEQIPADHETYLQVLQSADGVVVADAVLFARTDEDLPLIVDNAADSDPRTGFTKTGGWTLPTPLLPGHYSSNYFQAESAGNSATWAADLLTAGNYDIFARWTADTDRTASANYLVSGATGPVVKDQTINGGAWVSLGRYYQPEGWASVQLTSGTGVTVADAVRFDYTTLPLSIVLDNTEDALPPHACSTVGGWPSNTTFTDAWNGEYQTHASGGTGTFRWTPTVPLRGYYAVYARWPTANSLFSTAAPFRIVYGLAQDQQEETRNMNLRTNGAKWNYLGTYLFEAGDSGFVELSGVADYKVLADAVKFVAEGH